MQDQHFTRYLLSSAFFKEHCFQWTGFTPVFNQFTFLFNEFQYS